MAIGHASASSSWSRAHCAVSAQKFLVKLVDLADFLQYPTRQFRRKSALRSRISFTARKPPGGRSDDARQRGIDTRLQHPSVGAARGGEPVSSPVYQSSTYVLPTPELGAEIAASWQPHRFYTRYGSPNVAQVEARSRSLEGAESVVAVGSGMAAIAAAILSHVRAGDHVVAQTAHYTAALSLLADWLPRQGVTVTQVDQTDLEAFRRAIGPKTRLVYTETPTNPTMALTDLEAVSALARAQGAIVVTDNTFASSFNQLPLTLASISSCTRPPNTSTAIAT